MSHDLIILGTDDLPDFPAEANMINDDINAHLSQHPDEIEHPTVSVQNMIDDMGQKFGTILNNDSVWNCCPQSSKTIEKATN